MSGIQNNEKIEKYLDELSAEYRNLLFKALIEQSKSAEEFNISDLLRLDNEVKKNLHYSYKNYEKKRKLLSTVGLLYMCFGVLIFFIYEITKIGYNSDAMISLISLIIGFVGLIICLMSYILPATLISSKRDKATEDNEQMVLLEYEVLTKWRDIEGLANDLAIDQSIRTSKSAIEYLLYSNLIDEQQYDVLKAFLKMRNEVAHASEVSYSCDEIRKALKAVDTVLKKLKKVLE